jgi:hypothetical protein
MGCHWSDILLIHSEIAKQGVKGLGLSVTEEEKFLEGLSISNVQDTTEKFSKKKCVIQLSQQRPHFLECFS